MMESEDIRWKQRYHNFEKALMYLEDALKIENPDMIQKAGLIQFSEISFELSWKVMKDYLQEQGTIDVQYPKEVIKSAFETGLIQNGHTWMKALTDRNLTSHTYNETLADEVVSEIKRLYYPMLNQLYNSLKVKL